jgi:hypothetical protein
MIELAVLHLINVGIGMQEYKKTFRMWRLIFRMLGNRLRNGNGEIILFIDICG